MAAVFFEVVVAIGWGFALSNLECKFKGCGNTTSNVVRYRRNSCLVVADGREKGCKRTLLKESIKVIGKLPEKQVSKQVPLFSNVKKASLQSSRAGTDSSVPERSRVSARGSRPSLFDGLSSGCSRFGAGQNLGASGRASGTSSGKPVQHCEGSEGLHLERTADTIPFTSSVMQVIEDSGLNTSECVE